MRRFDGLIAASIGRWRNVGDVNIIDGNLAVSAIGGGHGGGVTARRAIAVADGCPTAAVAIAQIPTVDDIATSTDAGG